MKQVRWSQQPKKGATHYKKITPLVAVKNNRKHPTPRTLVHFNRVLILCNYWWWNFNSSKIFIAYM